ncbi:MAG TPA: hypothetical protein VLT33_36225 [Labilithrix sp.]|nr:hypothetical protein [Labilithrix sp.]
MLPSLDVFVVVNAPSSGSGAALRASVAAALRERARGLAEGDAPWLRGLRNPIDVRALVTGDADPSAELRTIGWLEENGTRGGADRFAAAAEAALAAAAADEGRKEGIVASLHAALALPRATRSASRIIVLVSTEDDTTAPAATDPLLRADDTLVVALAGSADGSACSTSPAPRLEAWARANGGSVASPCTGIDLRTLFVDYGSRCLPHPPRRAAGATSCRLRAIVPAGTACDPARGWRTPETAPRDGSTSCDVVAIDDGDVDASACRDGSSHYEGHASGWCLPAATPACGNPAPRLVGGAAPPWATLETTCDLEATP